MNYDLPDFPPDVQYEVEVAKIWYGDKLKRRMQDPRYRHYWRVDPEDLLIVYILSVWRVFLREADARCLWRAADLNSKALEFLRQLTKELHFEKGFDYEGRRLPAMLAIDGVILDRVMQKFLRSGTWEYFEEVRLRATKPQAPAESREAEAKPEKQQQESAPATPVAVPAPTATATALAQELIQVNNTVYVVPQPARRTKKRKRKHKPTGPRVDEPAASSPAQSAANKAATEPEPAVEAPQQSAAPGAQVATESEPAKQPAAVYVDPQQPEAPVLASPELSRKDHIDEFLRRMRKSPEPEFNYTQFCMVAGVNGADFRRWKRNDSRTTLGTGKRIERVLRMQRDEFIRELKSHTQH